MALFRAPLTRVKGLGSAKEGVEHWWWQRLTALALVPLCLWFVFSVISLVGESHEVVRAWMSELFNSSMTILMLIMLFHHAQLGLQVVIEDYVHHEAIKMGAIVAVKFLSFALALTGIVAVLRLQLQGPLTL